MMLGTEALLERLKDSATIKSLGKTVRTAGHVIASGSAGSSTHWLAGALALQEQCLVAVLVAHLDEAEHAQDDLESAGLTVLRLPMLEVGYDGTVGLDSLARRLSTLRGLESLRERTPAVLFCSIQAAMQPVPRAEVMHAITRTCTVGQRIPSNELLTWLGNAGYERRESVEQPGEFAVRGGIVDLYPPGVELPVRLDFFGDQIESIHEIDPQTLGSDRRLDKVELISTKANDDRGICVFDLLPAKTLAIVAETSDVVEQGRGFFERAGTAHAVLGPPAVLQSFKAHTAGLIEVNQYSAGSVKAQGEAQLPIEPLPEFDRDTATAIGELAQIGTEAQVLAVGHNQAEAQRLTDLIASTLGEVPKHIRVVVGRVERGFIWREQPAVAVVPSHELFHRFDTRRGTAGRKSGGRTIDGFLEFAPGDTVVHADHGLAEFLGLEVITPTSRRGTDRPDPQEFLTLKFSGNAKLHVPCTQIDLVQRYVGGGVRASGRSRPVLSALGGQRWQKQKEKAAEGVRDLAAELLRVRAAREAMPGFRYPPDGKWQTAFEAEFPFEETPDQLTSLVEIKRDLQSQRPMDRLLCGDVGFGKTELAIRAAFKACEAGKQVAVLVPTTVLAEQHERTFRSRFADYPFKVESISRFKTPKEVNAVLAALRRGELDVIIGTHRLISKDVKFNDLGLVVIDEEQRFGVEHKERLLQLRMTVDVLTLSATPIPRTLNMAMMGLRDISSLTTPPADRRAIITDVVPFNIKRIEQAISRELSREGQVYVVHNRVHNIQSVADRIASLAPGAKIVIGHGQMPPHELEEVMLTFIRRQADILVSTTIIESGIDIPTANTMIILDADRFGLSELHQLRGRVGRSKHRAYCYLVLPEDRPVKDIAQRRLRALEEHSTLGAGFKIAIRDLEIRGAGDLLGAEQSGHIAAVGYDMFCRLLERAVQELKQERPKPIASSTTVDLGIAGLIPRAYIPADQRRMDAYRRLATAGSREEITQVCEDLIDAYGEPPEPVRRLISLAELRVLAATLDARSIARREQDIVFRAADPHPIARAMHTAKGTVRVLEPKSNEALSEVYYRPPESYTKDTASLVRVLISTLARAVEQPREPSGGTGLRPVSS